MLEGIDSPSESRALVVLEPEIIAPPPRNVTRSDSAFLAHLIAMAERVPQMRRAEPEEAAAIYAAAAERFSVQ